MGLIVSLIGSIQRTIPHGNPILFGRPLVTASADKEHIANTPCFDCCFDEIFDFLCFVSYLPVHLIVHHIGVDKDGPDSESILIVHEGEKIIMEYLWGD